MLSFVEVIITTNAVVICIVVLPQMWNDYHICGMTTTFVVMTSTKLSIYLFVEVHQNPSRFVGEFNGSLVLDKF
jgi:hypothetical protein